MSNLQTTILLVEDDNFARPFLVRCLEVVGGYKVLAAANGDEAATQCAAYKGRIDLLITDVNLEADDGRALARRLCALRPEMPVLFISGADPADLANRGLIDRRAAFIQKPFLPKVLLDMVRTMIEEAA